MVCAHSGAVIDGYPPVQQVKMAFSNVATLLRIHLAGYIGIKDLLALHNRKKKRVKKKGKEAGLFAP